MVALLQITSIPPNPKEILTQTKLPLSHLKLKLLSHAICLQKGFNRLSCLSQISIEPKPWQTEAALKTLRDMQGSSILADEVGLGKTIEAGLILKELLVRDLIHSVLVLVPASLVEQWKEEMKEKFNIILKDVRENKWENNPLLICSIDAAIRSPRKETLSQWSFDVLIIDEAQRLKRNTNKTYKFVFGLQKRNTLLLSATPVQNDLNELFNLVNIIKPGLLKSRKSFCDQYLVNKFKPKNVPKLKQFLSEVMIRNRRANTLVEMPRRIVKDEKVELNEDERRFFDGVIELAQDIYRDLRKEESPLLTLIRLLKQNCSSPQSVIKTLNDVTLPKLTETHLEQRCRDLLHLGESIRTPSKANRCLKMIKSFDDQVIVYSEYLTTIDMLKTILKENNIEFTLYHGQLPRLARVSALETFRNGEVRVLISSEAGGQGLNLQNCHKLINYDLPWNPMRIEQRIGRIHRYGQRSEVEIYNLATKGTLDEYILYLLTAKVNLFETVIGGLDTIISYVLDEDSSMDYRIGKILLTHRDPKEIKKRLEELGDRILRAKGDLETEDARSQKILNEIGVGS